MFDLFNALPPTGWFYLPGDELSKLVICSRSGYLAGPNCLDTDTILMIDAGKTTDPCPYHKIVHLSGDGKFRVNSNCMPLSEIVNQDWFVLPPLMEYYYKQRDPLYRELPPLKDGCNSDAIEELEIVYPEWGSHIMIPVELDGSPGRLVMEVAHRDPSATVYWHIDDHYAGFTRGVHQLGMKPDPGEHILTVVDHMGHEKTVRFNLLER